DSEGTLSARIDFAARSGGTFFLDAGSYTQLTGAYALSAARLGAAPADDAPNDNTTTIRLADDGSARTGSIEAPGDRDRFILDVVEGAEYLISLRGSGSGALADPFLRIFDGESRQIASNDDGGEDRDSELVFEATSTGRIFVEAGAFGDDGTGRYAVSAERQSGAGAGDPPADDTSTARVEVDGTFDGELEVAGDRDWIGVELTGGGVYDVSLAGFGDPSLADPLLRIIDPDGQQVALNDDFDGLDSRIESFVADQTGLFFVSAGSYADAGVGGYRVAVDQIGGGAGETPGDATTTESVAVGGSVTGVLEVEGDRDWYRVDLEAGGVYEIALNGTGGAGGLSDPLLRLYDPDSDLVATNDDGGPDLNSLLTVTAGETGTFFVAAGGFADNRAGEYEITVDQIGGGGSGGDDFSDDITGDVGRVEVNDFATGELEQARDVDVFAVDLVAGQAYDFFVFGQSSGGGDLRDPTLTLFDSFGNQLDFDDDGGFGRDPSIDFFNFFSGTYFLAVAGFGENFGTYQVAAITSSLFGASAGAERGALYASATGFDEPHRDEDGAAWLL
ncbi:MAG: pre-peptidase C-terminal domain-containing protein, partial [Pseudomonadota bacterium]